MALILRNEVEAARKDFKLECLAKAQVWMSEGTANGWTRYNEPRTYTQGQLKAKIVEQMAGKAAEMSVFSAAKGHGPDSSNAYAVANKCQVWMSEDGTANGWTRYNESRRYKKREELKRRKRMKMTTFLRP
ncbi:hypothetical protein GPALN_010740 [Globodera pallida]|nr:hypothetical protein GPALN_010740 [Globodera pallida]